MTVKLHRGDCLKVTPTFEKESIDLIVTSPPYFNLRDYSQWATYSAYLQDMRLAMQECSRLIKPGRHVCWNVQPYLPDKKDGARWHHPLSADIIHLAYDAGMMLDSTIIWHKTNARCQRMFGSYPYPPSIIYTPNAEDIHIFRKPGKADYRRTDDSRLSKQEWIDWTTRIWDIAVDYVARGHPAHFPLELPRRLIRLHSLTEDVVLDPFSGSGTTGIACIQTGRRFIRIEISEDYFKIAERRIAEAQMQPALEGL